jgi:hypothetical protein
MECRKQNKKREGVLGVARGERKKKKRKKIIKERGECEGMGSGN